MDIGSAGVLIPEIYKPGPPIVFTIECGVSYEIERRSAISFKLVSFMVYIFRSATNHRPFKYRYPLKNCNE
jgi:hypothetical protein